MKDVLFIASEGSNVPLSADNNDIQFVDGDIALVSGPARKFQDVAKILLTQLGADSVLPTYGSDVVAAVGTKFSAATPQEVADSVTQAMAFLVAVEQSNLANETITGIESLYVQQSQADDRELDVRLTVNLQSLQSVPVTLGS